MGNNNSPDNKNNDKKEEAAIAPLMSMMQPAFMGNNLMRGAQQMAAGGYGSQGQIQDHLAGIHSPMQMSYVQPDGFGPMYSGAAYMDALRKKLEAAGITQDGSKDDKKDWSKY